MSILVVEDEIIVREDLRRSLIALGYTMLDAVGSGEEALAIVEQSLPKLVLMDIQLQGELDGIETSAKLRARWDVPVVYLTSHSDARTIERAMKTEPYGYLIKPFDEHDLRTAVEVALRKHEVESVLAARERWFATTLRSIGDAVLATDLSERVTFLNAVAEELTGWTLEEARGKPLREVLRLVDEHGVTVSSPVGRAIREGFRVELPANTRLVSKGGITSDVDDSASAIVDDRGQLLGGVVIFRDITERRKLEERLLRAERLATVGTMSAGLAHELNNPLAAAVANNAYALTASQDLLERLARRGDAQAEVSQVRDLIDALRDIELSNDRMRRLIQDMRRFVRNEGLERKIVDLPAAIEAAIQMTQNEVRHAAQLFREYTTTPYVEANEGQLVQVFANLLVNAAQAIGPGEASANAIRVTTRTDEQGRAIVEIHDTGPGIPREALRRVFDPFFTTKPAGLGMGLGLSICHSLIVALGGEIDAESEVGIGTTFRVVLPGATTPKLDSVPPTKPPSPARRARVLVIDDEELVAKSMARALRTQHDVILETSAVSALRRLATDHGFDVIFCDMMMPDMTGVEVYERVLARTPELAARIVFLTGGAFSPRTTDFLATATNVVLAKPATMANLESVIADFTK